MPTTPSDPSFPPTSPRQHGKRSLTAFDDPLLRPAETWSYQLTNYGGDIRHLLQYSVKDSVWWNVRRLGSEKSAEATMEVQYAIKTIIVPAMEAQLMHPGATVKEDDKENYIPPAQPGATASYRPTKRMRTTRVPSVTRAVTPSASSCELARSAQRADRAESESLQDEQDDESMIVDDG